MGRNPSQRNILKPVILTLFDHPYFAHPYFAHPYFAHLLAYKMQRFQTEIAMMMTLRHPNIVQIFGGCWPQEEDGGDRYCNLFSTCIVMEYCQMGSLFDTVLRYGNDIPWYPPNYSKDNGTDGDPMLAAIARAASSSKPSRTSLSSLESNVQYKLDWCRQIARGMAYLHSQKNPVMHRDLKCSNVLVSKGFTLKIADFGESRRRHKTFVLENMEVSTGVGGFGAAGGASKAASVALGE